MYFRSLRLAAAGIVVAVMLPTAGCATEYVPRTSHRISIVESGGVAKFTRDSQTFGMQDLDQAVTGNPEAEAHARTYRHRTAEGIVGEIAGFGLIVGGVSLAAGPSSSSTRRDVGSGLALGGVVALVGAFVAILSGPPHIYDAINIYNDGVPPEANRQDSAATAEETSRPPSSPRVASAPPRVSEGHFA